MVELKLIILENYSKWLNVPVRIGWWRIQVKMTDHDRFEVKGDMAYRSEGYLKPLHILISWFFQRWYMSRYKRRDPYTASSQVWILYTSHHHSNRDLTDFMWVSSHLGINEGNALIPLNDQRRSRNYQVGYNSPIQPKKAMVEFISDATLKKIVQSRLHSPCQI